MKTLYNFLFALSLIFTLSLLNTGCGNRHAHEGEEAEDHHHHNEEGAEIELTEKQIATVGIDIGEFTEKEIGSGINATGVLAVNPQAMAEVAPLLSGVVKAINVTEGSYVGAGTIVATIENLDIINYKRDYQEALQELNLAKSEKNRQATLAEAGAGVRKNLEKAESAVLSAKYKVEAIENQMRVAGIDLKKVASATASSTAIVKAPISGIVNRIDAKIGAFADMSRPLMTITDNSQIFAILRIFEKDINLVQKGAGVDLSLTNSSELLQGKVAEINKTLDPETKGIDVKVSIVAGERRNLIPGMAVNGVISTGKTLSTVLPEGAVVTIGGKEYIYMLEDTKMENGVKTYHFEPVEVVTGAKSQGFVEVRPLKDVPADAKFVISKAYYLSSMSTDHGEHNH